MEVINIKDLSFRYPDTESYALNNLSISIDEGDFVVICGPTGCGKSTLLRLLKKEIAPHGHLTGEISYFNKPIDKWDERKLIEDIGFIFQDPDNQIVLDNVLQEMVFGLENLGHSNVDMRKRIAELTHTFGYEQLLHEKPSELSGGQKQILNLNVLWLVSEDNSPLLGCYGNDFATTPNLDQLASEGFLYSHAYANAPVCAPARNTIITGVYASSNGNEHMRSNYPLSDEIRAFPEYLQKAGYYCTNNSKTDYNTSSIDVKEIWNENSSRAHYKNRDPGQPFFAIFNSSITHEGSIHDSLPDEQLRHNPDAVSIPPYHPSTEAIKHDWA